MNSTDGLTRRLKITTQIQKQLLNSGRITPVELGLKGTCDRIQHRLIGVPTIGDWEDENRIRIVLCQR